MATPDTGAAARDRAILDRVRGLVIGSLGGQRAAVYLFGSWATGRHHAASDIDVAIDAVEPLAPGILARLRETPEESTIPYRVDVVDLAETDPAFRERVRREGVAWTVSTRLTSATLAVETLRELALIAGPTRIQRDAAIQRFAYSFEATWAVAPAAPLRS